MVYVAHVFARDPADRAHVDSLTCVFAKDRAALVHELMSIDPDGVLLWLYWIVGTDGEPTPVSLCDAYGAPAYSLTSNFVEMIEPHFRDLAKSASVSARLSIL